MDQAEDQAQASASERVLRAIDDITTALVEVFGPQETRLTFGDVLAVSTLVETVVQLRLGAGLAAQYPDKYKGVFAAQRRLEAEATRQLLKRLGGQD